MRNKSLLALLLAGLASMGCLSNGQRAEAAKADRQSCYADLEFTVVEDGSTFILPGEEIESVKVAKDRALGNLDIDIRFTKKGSALFADFTGKNTSNTVKLAVKGEELVTARIMEPISGGVARLSHSSAGITIEELTDKFKRD
jgi:preprotein translocase subunit SecD